jgi:hypothetical protein
MAIFSALKKIRTATDSLRRSGGDPANTPTAATNATASNLPAHVQAQLQSAQIIETLVQLYGGPQENNRLEISEDRSPSSKFDNVLKTSNLLATQSEFIDSVVTPIGGLYGIVLRASPGQISSTNLEATTTEQNLRSVGNSVWGAILGAARGVHETFDDDEPALTLEVLKFPEYYVFIFANTSPDSPIPILVEENDVLEYDSITSYPKAIITNTKLREEILQPGTLIRLEYDGVDNKNIPVITEIVEGKPEFTRMVMNSMKNRSAFLSSTQCATDSALEGVTHSSGDPVAGESSAVNLHNGYMELERQAGVNKVDVSTLYTLLKTAFEQVGINDTNLVIGILANAKQESNFNSNVVSRVETESSIGLWQFNVQNPGYYNAPNSQIRQRAAALPESIRIPTDQKVVPYFAGGLLLGSKGIAAITPAAYDGSQDLKPLYDIVSSSTNQIVFVATTTKRMLDTISYTPGQISAGAWATWFQIYFEQPGAIHDRASVASAVTSDLQERGVTV